MNASQPKYDVFISYSHNDLDWTRNRLLPQLDMHGFTTCIDYRDFVTGSPSIVEMERCVLESSRVLIVLSKSYIRSEWTQFENIMAQTLDPAAVSRKVIPVKIEDCEIPLRLRILHYRDVSTNDDQQWQLLIRDLI